MNKSYKGGGSHGGTGQLSRGRSSKKLQDDRPFPPQLEEHPYFNYFPTAQQNYYTRYVSYFIKCMKVQFFISKLVKFPNINLIFLQKQT